MSIESLTIVGKFLGDGVQTTFPAGFPLFGDGRHARAVTSTGSGLTLEERELVYGTDYTVIEVPGGGKCITTAPVPDGHRLVLSLALPVTQPRDFNNQGRLDAEEIEKGLDYVTALTAQNAAALKRAVKVPISGTQSPEELLAGIFAARDDSRASAQDAALSAGEAESAAARAA